MKTNYYDHDFFSEKKTQAIAMLKHEIKLREDLLKKAQSELQEINSSNTVKVDRYLVKNLVVGYVNADQAKKREVLKIIGEFTFLDNDLPRLLKKISSSSCIRNSIFNFFLSYTLCITHAK